MKTKIKRLLSVLLVFVMMMGMMPNLALNAHAVVPLLPAPVITVDENGVATWPAVEGAARYGYSISTAGGWFFTNECDIPATLASYGEESGTYTLTVWAADDDKNQISEKASVEYSYTKSHVHEWATDWTYNDYDHWHECLNTPCSLSVVNRDGYGPHVFSAEGVCICGKEGEPDSTYEVNVIGGKTEDDKTEYAPGDSVTIIADDAASEMQFKEWTGVDGLTFTSGDKNSATATFTMPSSPVTVTATYEPLPATYHITVVGGTPDKYEAKVGETIKIKADEPASNMKFAGWKVTVDEMFVNVTLDDASAEETTFVMPEGDVRIDATYEPLPATYHITVVGGTPDKYEAKVGETIKIKADEPASNMKFAGWKVTVDEMFVNVTLDDASAEETTFVMPEGDVRIDATYEPLPATYHITVVGGTPDKYEAKAGETIKIKADEPASNMKFAGWKVTVDEMFVNVTLDDASAEETTFVMPEGDVRIDATYEPLPATYHITVVGGTPDKYEAKAGETIKIKADEPASNMKFAGWKVTVDEMFVNVTLDDASAEETTFVMPEGDVRIDATYEPLPATYHITVVGGTPDKYEAKAGETIKIKAGEPASDMKFAGWKVTVDEMFVNVTLDDASAEETTFVMPEGDVRIDALYEEITSDEGGNDDTAEPTPPSSPSVPDTSDNTNTLGWMITLLFSMVALVIVIKKKKELNE